MKIFAPSYQLSTFPIKGPAKKTKTSRFLSLSLSLTHSFTLLCSPSKSHSTSPLAFPLLCFSHFSLSPFTLFLPSTFSIVSNLSSFSFVETPLLLILQSNFLLFYFLFLGLSLAFLSQTGSFSSSFNHTTSFPFCTF